MLGSDTKSNLNSGVTALPYRSIERGCDAISLPSGTWFAMRESVGVQRIGSDCEPVRDTQARRVVTRPASNILSGTAMQAIHR